MKQVTIIFLVLAFAFCSSALIKGKKQKGLGDPIGTCTQDGEYLADDYECATFYHCDENLVPEPQHCVEGLCWYQAARECVWPDPTTCTCP